MKQKWVSLALIGMTVLSLTACGSRAAGEGTESAGAQSKEETDKEAGQTKGSGKEEKDASGEGKEKEETPDKIKADGELEEAEQIKAEKKDLTDLPDFDRQIDLILEKRQDWMIEEESWDNPNYAVTDMDQNGRLEIIYEQLQGTGRFTDLALYEVSEDRKSLNSIPVSDEEEADAPDVGDENVVTMIEQDGTVHYLFKNGTKNGIAEYYETTCDVTLKNGRWEQKPLGYYSAVYENYYTDAAGEDELKETFENAEENAITEEEYNNLGRSAYPGADEDVAVFGWFNKYAYFGVVSITPFMVKEDGSSEEVYEEKVKVCDLEEEKLREQLTASAAVFSPRAQSTWDKPLSVEVHRDYQDEWDEDNDHLLYSGYYDMIHLADVCRAAHPRLAKALDQFNSDNYSQLSATWESLKKDAGELMTPEGEPGQTLYANDELKLRRADDGVFSFTEYYEGYYGGAHGEGSYVGHNYDVRTGNEIRIGDVVKDRDKLTELLIKKLEEKYGEYLFEEAKDTVKDAEEYNFTIDPDGLSFYWGPYELAPYAAGMLQVKLLFDEASELFTEAYGKMQGSYCIEFGREQSLLIDMNGDGKTDELSADCDDDGYGSCEHLYVELNGQTYQDEEFYGYGFTPVLVHLDQDHNFLYLQCSYDNDYKAVLPFDLSDGRIRPFDEPIAGDLSGHLQSYTGSWYGNWRTVLNDPSEVEQIARMDMLSTTSGYRVGRINEKGELESEEDYLLLSQFVLKVKMNFPAALLDQNRKEIKNMEIKQGDTFRIMYTDGKSYVDGMLSDGSMVRVHLKGEGWPLRIGSYEAADVFDGMMFAG